jgi:hypothetical protein
MSDTEAVPDTPVEETPKGEEEPLNDVSKKVEREEDEDRSMARMGSREKVRRADLCVCSLSYSTGGEAVHRQPGVQDHGGGPPRVVWGARRDHLCPCHQ